MALFYLIRHGEPDYEAVSKIGFYGFGRSFAPLSKKGIQQAQETANDPRLVEADLIICSPYTRALQTAAIISRKVNKEIIVGHGMAFRALKYIENIAPGEIVECRYERGQADCEYAFSNKIRFQ